jgi:hypothetical protein
MFEYVGFYVGNNGSVYFFQLNSPVPSTANVTLLFCGTVATLLIKSSAGKQKYTMITARASAPTVASVPTATFRSTTM